MKFDGYISIAAGHSGIVLRKDEWTELFKREPITILHKGKPVTAWIEMQGSDMFVWRRAGIFVFTLDIGMTAEEDVTWTRGHGAAVKAALVAAHALARSR